MKPSILGDLMTECDGAERLRRITRQLEMLTMDRKKRDVAASSAALLYNLLPVLAELPPAEQYKRLVGVFIGNLNAYEDVPEPEFRLPEPSNN